MHTLRSRCRVGLGSLLSNTTGSQDVSVGGSALQERHPTSAPCALEETAD